MDAEEILQAVKGWGRARNALRAGLAVGLLLLGGAFLLRLGGGSFPAFLWFLVPLAAVGSGAWPVAGDGFLLWAGRRVGVGERLAALAAALRERAEAFVSLLGAEVAAARPRGWRLLGWPEGALALGCVLLGAALVFAPLGTPAVPAPTEDAPTGVPEAALPTPPPEPSAPEPRAERAVSLFPELPELPPYSPYEDLLASLLGIEPGALAPEELAERLAREEGLLRSLAERLRLAAQGGLSPAERAELAPLARELARADLRERVSRLVERGDEGGAAEAAEAVEAALRTVEEATQRGERAEEPGEGSASGSGPGTPAGELADLPDEGLPGGARAEAGEESEPEDRPGRVPTDEPGTEAGEPLAFGLRGAWETQAVGEEQVPVVGGEGPVRAHLVPTVPGEPASPRAQSPAALGPQEVEVVLRTRGVPPELREVVRRYFELIGGNP